MEDNFEIMPPPPEIIEQWVRESEIREAKEYLASTDWYIVRMLETGTPVPAEVTEKRALSRVAASIE